MPIVDTEATVEIEGVVHRGMAGGRWLKDLGAEELRELVLRLARLLADEEEAHRETKQLASDRGCSV